MAERARIGLDNPTFKGRLRRSSDHVLSFEAAVAAKARPSVRYYNNDDIRPPRAQQLPIMAPAPKSSTPAPLEIIAPQPYAQPAAPRQQRSAVLRRSSRSGARLKTSRLTQARSLRMSTSKLQISLMALAGFIFLVGLFVSVQTIQTNHTASAQVAALSKATELSPAIIPSTTSITKSVPVPSTVRPPAAAVASYSVGPLEPKYLTIPSLGVHAIILNLGILKSGALATPPNVFETGWYNKSALPGQPGAMLIDGHVSSWTTHGVFYGIRNLKPGMTLSITRGDGTVFDYKVVTSQVFNASNVDMLSAITPIVAGTPGLNLITCDGQVVAGTSTFNQRVIVYTEQI